MATPQIILSLASVLCMLACGARPGLGPWHQAGQADGGLRDSGAPDAFLIPDAEPLPSHCTWTPGQLIQVTQPPSDKALHSLVLSEGSMLLGHKTTNPDPPHDNTHYLTRLSLLGAPLDDRVAIFPPSAGWFHGYMSLGAASGHQGAIVWDNSRGCRFRPLDPMGSPLGGPQEVGSDRCALFQATHGGFSFFATSLSAAGLSEWRLVNLDAQGTVIHQSAPIPALSNDAFWWATVSLPDGTSVVAGMDQGLEPSVIRSQHIDHRGAPLADPVLLTQLSTSASAVRLVHTGEGLLAGWLASDQANDESQRRRLTLQRLDLEGRPISEPFQPTDILWYRDARWSWQRQGQQVLTVLVAADEESSPYGDATTVMLLPLEASGNLADPPVPLANLRFVRKPLVRSTPQGVLVAFTGILDEPIAHQIFAISATCVEDSWP